jgi:hypothetical protein
MNTQTINHYQCQADEQNKGIIRKLLDHNLISQDSIENEKEILVTMIHNPTYEKEFIEQINKVHNRILRNYTTEKDFSETYIRLFYRNLLEDPLYKSIKMEEIQRERVSKSMIRYMLSHFLMFIATFFEINSKFINFNVTDQIIDLFKQNRINELKFLLIQEVRDLKMKVLIKYLNIQKFYEIVYFNSPSFIIFIFNSFINLRSLKNCDNDTGLIRAISMYKISSILFKFI